MSSGPSLTVHLGVAGLGTVQAAFAKVQGMAGSLGAGLKTMALSAVALLGGAASVAGVAAGLKEALDMGGHISDVAARTGIAARAVTVLEQAFKDSGVAAESVGKSVAKMQDALVSASRGDAAPARAFETLKLNVAELLTQEPDQQFANIGKAIASLDSPARRTAAAMDIFGRSGSELMALFRGSQVFEVAAQRVGGLADVMGRRADVFDAISDSIGGIKVKIVGFFAGLGDLLVPELARMSAAIDDLDLTPIGQKFGALVSFVIEEWRAGRIGELISLTIEAGFEAGGLAARTAWDGVVAMLGSGGFWAQLTDAAITAAIAITKSLTQAIYALSEPVLALQFFVVDAFRKSYADSWDVFKALGALAVNWIAEKLEAAFAAVGRFAAALPIPGASAFQGMEPKFGRVSVGAPTAAPAMSWDAAKAKAAEQAQWASSTVGGFFDRGAAASHGLLGTGSDAAARGDRLNELNGKLNAIIAERSKHEHAATEAAAATIPMVNAKLQLAEMEKRSKAMLLELENRRALIERNLGITAADKWRLKKKSLEEERETLKQIVAALREKAALETDPTAKEQILTRADSHEQKLSGVNRRLGTAGPDPYSSPDQIRAAMTGLQDQFGTTAQAIARSFTSVVGSAVESVAQGIEGLIMGTMTWGDALRDIGRTMLTTIVQAISRMFAEWIAKRALAAAKNMLFSAQEGVADTAAKTPGAVLSSISSWGVAAAVGVAAVVAALAAFGGFQSGGYTGDRPPGEVAGVVHGKEFVFDAPAVQRIGLDNLEAMRSGAVPASPGGSNQPTLVNNAVQIASFDSRQDARRWANSQESEVWFVDMARKTSHRWNRA